VCKIIVIAFIGFFGSQFAFGTTPHDTTAAETRGLGRRYIPHYVPIQYAGNIGYISAGVGYIATRDKVHFSLQYGFTPESVGGIEIHTLTFRNIFHLYKLQLNKQTIIPYAGLGLSWDMSGRSFFSLPDNMPKGYYKFPKSVHLIPTLGIKIRHPANQLKVLRSVELFAEATTVDEYIWFKAISREVRMSQIVSLSLGVNLIRR
jgi:hypothetical protein